MSRIRAKDTAPERRVRQILHRLGYRFRIHVEKLPGRPDVVFKKRRAVVLVHGCYWHGHGCRRSHQPRSNTGYWGPKIERNRARDAATLAALQAAGWRVLVVWECETADANMLGERLGAFLGPPGAFRPRPGPE